MAPNAAILICAQAAVTSARRPKIGGLQDLVNIHITCAHNGLSFDEASNNKTRLLMRSRGLHMSAGELLGRV